MADFSPPYLTRWPASLLQPAGVHEFVTAAYLVHEAAHAVIAHVLGVPIRRLWARAADHAGGVEFPAGYRWADSGDDGALIAFAARPAVHTYLRLTGTDNVTNISSFNEMFDHDEADAGECGARSDLASLRLRAEHLVEEQWSAICELAQKLGDAQGLLSGADAFS